MRLHEGHMRALTAAGALTALCLWCGCTVLPASEITGQGSLKASPAGPTAVLRVTAAPDSVPRTGGTTWGLVNTPNAADRFAEFLAYQAAHEGGMTVMTPLEVAGKFKAAGLQFALQPDAEQLKAYVAALGCSSYLTAEIEESRVDYRFFVSWATLTYHLACYRPDAAEPIWQVDVRRKEPRKSDRELMEMALKETFQWLRARPAGAEGGGQ